MLTRPSWKSASVDGTSLRVILNQVLSTYLVETPTYQLSCNSCSSLTKTGMRVEKTLIQTLASQLSTILKQLMFSFN